jgi:hypothetical protein
MGIQVTYICGLVLGDDDIDSRRSRLAKLTCSCCWLVSSSAADATTRSGEISVLMKTSMCNDDQWILIGCDGIEWEFKIPNIIDFNTTIAL